MNAKGASTKKNYNTKYRSLFKKDWPGVCRGTDQEVEGFNIHVQKGCLEDPLKSMHWKLDPNDQYSDLFLLRGSSVVESNNRSINMLAHSIIQMTADLCHKKTWLKITNINLNKDATYKKLLNINQPRTFDWYLHEVLFQQIPHLSTYNKITFPPKIEEGYTKPMGIKYG